MLNMNNTINHFTRYNKVSGEIWKNRFTWKESGKYPKHTTSIYNFLQSTNILNNITYAYNVCDLFKLIDKLSDEYIEWVKSKHKSYTKKDYDNMKTFFIGAIGEYFVFRLLNDVKCIMVSIDGDAKCERFDFNYVSPTLSGEESDCGIDMYCIANDVQSVMQIKFWNPFTKNKLEPKIYHSMNSEGIDKEFINHSDNNNIFLFWLGNENTAYSSIVGKETIRKKHFVVIGKKSLMASIDNRNKVFWDNFYKSLQEL
jgi:hypothetical protein